jgi:CheY-like chemotaxis protein
VAGDPSLVDPPSDGQPSDEEVAKTIRDWSFLVVDDNPGALSILRSMLGMLGVEPPLEAMDGAMAMELVRENTFDCIITDVRMEPMSGAEFVRWVRRSNEAANAAVRILAISAYRDAKEVGELRAEGADGFVTKPLSVPLLQHALAAVVRNPRSFVEIISSADAPLPSIRRHESVAQVAANKPRGA